MRGGKNIWIVAILLLLCACEHRELKLLDELRYIRVYLDEEIRNVSFGFYDENNIKPDYHSPEILRVVFCNTQEGKVIKETYLRNKGIDERGVYLEGEVLLKSGDYR
ncbi:MAG: hypothetical protein IKU29_11170, partial [Parabacteroides sp.]|nr:hypothetical protein [Parabacteroides sp.]